MVPKHTIRSICKKLMLFLIGSGAVVLLVHAAGSEAVRGSLMQAAPFIPLLILLEGGRIVCEAICTYIIIADARASVPWRTLLRASLLSYSVCVIAPIGRPLGEAVRANMIEPFTGSDRALIAATANQTLTLVASAVLAAAAAVWVVISRPNNLLTWALVGYALTACGVALAIQTVARWRGFVEWVIGVVPRYRRAVAGFYRSAKRAAYLPIRPLLVMVVGRLFQATQFGVLGSALGFGFDLDAILIGQGVNLIGGALGDWIPAQVGSIDAAFAMAASHIGIPTAVGVSIAVMIHCVQLFWVVTGAMVPLLGQARQKPTNAVRLETVRVLISSPRNTKYE